MAFEVARFDVLLGVVPGTAGIRHEERKRGTDSDRAREHARECGRAHQEANTDGSENRYATGKHHLRERCLGGDVDDCRAFRFSFAFAETRDLVELTNDLCNDGLCSLADRDHRRGANRVGQTCA